MEDEQATPASAIHKAFAVIAPLQGEAACYVLLQTYVPGDASEAGECVVPDDATERASVITTTSSSPTSALTCTFPHSALANATRMGHFDAQKQNTPV